MLADRVLAVGEHRFIVAPVVKRALRQPEKKSLKEKSQDG